MTSKEFVLNTLKRYGKAVAQALQEKADNMTGTELYDEFAYIPSYYSAIAKMNMKDRPIGFVCRSPKGRVMRLLQKYDSDIYTQEPEELLAQWGFKWSTNPKHALPFISLSTSPYNEGDCCVGSDGVIYRSKINTNTWNPVEVPQYWEAVTE